MWGPLGGSIKGGVWLNKSSRLSLRLERGAYIDDPYECLEVYCLSSHPLHVLRFDHTIAQKLLPLGFRIFDFGEAHQKWLNSRLRIFAFGGLGRRTIRNFQKYIAKEGPPGRFLLHSYEFSAEIDLIELGIGADFFLLQNLILGVEAPGPLIPFRCKNLRVRPLNSDYDPEEVYDAERKNDRYSKKIFWSIARIKASLNF